MASTRLLKAEGQVCGFVEHIFRTIVYGVDCYGSQVNTDRKAKGGGALESCPAMLS